MVLISYSKKLAGAAWKAMKTIEVRGHDFFKGWTRREAGEQHRLHPGTYKDCTCGSLTKN